MNVTCRGARFRSLAVGAIVKLTLDTAWKAMSVKMSKDRNLAHWHTPAS
jgi:hypothetical protein